MKGIMEEHFAPLIGFFLTIAAGVITNWLIYKKPRLRYWISSYSEFLEISENINVYVYNLTLQNAGRGSAANVKIIHPHLPADSFVRIYPTIDFHVEQVSGHDAAQAVRLPTMPGKSEVVVQYLTTRIIMLDTFVSGVVFDEGTASPVAMKPQVQLSTRTLAIIWAIYLFGLFAVIKIAYLLGPTVLNFLWSAIP
ncbi:hypothetical protein MYX64_06460 [Nitrospinae bacterium AH_259_B05_G02_I21]|nr:hypothetical protein [Nitrospinae bacterium AH_259_B05_G02_I21]